MSSISYHFELLSHPAKRLHDHLKNVATESKSLIEEKKIPDVDLLKDVAYLIGAAHDFGKGSVYFQDKLIKNIKTEKARHSQISAIWGYYLLKKYFGDDENQYQIIGYLVIARHHGDLINIKGTAGEERYIKDHKELLKKQIEGVLKNEKEIHKIYREILAEYSFDWSIEEFKKNFEALTSEITRRLHRVNKDGDFKFYITFMLLYSVLLDADKMDASDTRLPARETISPTLVDTYRVWKFSTLKSTETGKIRDEIYKEVMTFLGEFDPLTQKILSIELPTGSGKTLSAFSLALKMRNNIERDIGISPRIIYSLPFLSIIEQNANVLAEVLIGEITDKIGYEDIPSNLLLVHHHLSDIMYETDEDEYDINASKLLVEGWNSEVIITTFLQFFHTVISNKNRAIRKFHKIINSIIILDEVQNIPVKYWPLLSGILKCLALEFNTWFIVMSATMPFLFGEEDVVKIIKNPEKYYEHFNRNNYIVNDEEVDLEDFANALIEKIEESDEDILVILNRVSAVKKLYSILRECLFANGEVTECGILIDKARKIKVINLSTHIVPAHRFRRIAKIKENDGFRKIIISTQLVEAGVDISSKMLFRDMAPFDSIVQSGGRCNRSFEYGTLGGEVNIMRIVDGEPLWRRIYDPVLIKTTEDIIAAYLKFEEKNLRELTQRFFKEIVRKKSAESEIVEHILRHRYSEISKFKLIEEDYPKADVFVEIDENATEILRRYREILDIEDRFERRNEIERIKKQLYNYVISVPEKVIAKLNLSTITGENEGLYYLSRGELEDKYSLEVGISTDDKSFVI